MEDFYSLQTFDFKRIRGDTINLKFNFRDENNNPIIILNWNVKFSMRDPISNQIILPKSRTVGPPAINNGIYYKVDTNSSIIGITQDNELAVILNYSETELLPEGVYPFDLEFEITDIFTAKFTVVKGNLILSEEVTPS